MIKFSLRVTLGQIEQLKTSFSDSHRASEQEKGMPHLINRMKIRER